MCGASEILQGKEGGWVVVDPTQGEFFIGYVNIILLCMWLTVCGASEILQGKEGGWVVVDPHMVGCSLNIWLLSMVLS